MKIFYSFVFMLGMLIAYPSAARTNAIGEPSNLICNDLVYLSIEDISCSETINPDMVLEGQIGPDNEYVVELDKTLPMGNGPWVPAFVTEADINFTYTYRVTHIPSGNSCQGSIKIEDKLPPVLLCENFTVPCNAPDLTPSVLEDDYNVPAVPSVTDCQDVDLTYIDQETPRDCASGLSRTILRKWTAVDESGNVSTCEQIISFDRPGLADVAMPPDYDDFVAPAFPCTISEYPTPEWIESTGNQGFPYVFGLPEGCNIGWVYVDNTLKVCDGTYVVFRNWTVQDWCTGTGLTKMQIIRVVDKVAPPLACPANTTVSVDPLTCCGTIDMPDLILRDNCSQIKKIEGMVATFDPQTGDPTGMYTFDGTLKDFPGNNWWDADTLADFGVTPCLPIGTQTVTYRVEDDCGNARTCTFKMKIEDQVPPVAVCDEFTTVALTAEGKAVVDAAVFDDGSYDNCCVQNFRAARMSSNGCGGTNFSSTVPFCCNDLGEVVTIIFQVTDCNGNTNQCMVSAEVQDKIKPSCLPPANVTVNCENFDPSLWAYSRADVEDNCCLDDTKEYQGQEGLTHAANYTLFDTVCNKGTITRTFRAFDCQGNSSQCTQRIFVTYEQDYFIKFPNDAIVTVCDGTGNYGEPLFFGEDCELLGVSYADEVFTVVPDACFKIERSWQIINWCTYNPNGSCIDVPNPSPNPITNAPANLPGPTVSACGTIAPWAPTSVRINPGDPQATNFCTFYDKNANCYRYKQIIKIIDGQQPTGNYTVPTCSNQNWTTPNHAQLWNEMYWWNNGLQVHDLCEEPTDLCITATDACSGTNVNIEYLLFLDLDGDGTMETVVNSVNTGLAGLGWNNVLYNNLNTPNFSGGTARVFDERPVPVNQKYGFTIQETIVGNNKTACVRWNTQQQQNNFVVPELPHGTHKIKWFITDGCGNNTEYEYTFTVKDCKAPTVVCLNGLSVNIMPSGMISLWASDFLQYTEDNCTPSGQLKIGIRKCGTGTGFPVDGNGNPITNVSFTCVETGTQCVELWSIDAAGNADYCETYVIVQDNWGNCGGTPMVSIFGQIKTAFDDGVEEVALNFNGTSLWTPVFNINLLTNTNGYFSINNLPPLSSFSLVPEKDDNPLNGVTTYDLVLMSKHILGLEPLDSPYKMIAADANKSGSITTFDIVELRKLILGIYTELPNNTSWRFVDKSFVFPASNNPFQSSFPESASFTDIIFGTFETDFVGIKVGDVNNSVVANLNQPVDERSQGNAIFEIEDRLLHKGEELEVTFTAAQLLQGFQFTLLQDGLKTIGVKETEGITAANFGTIFDGATTVSVDGAQSFTLRMRAEKAGKLSEMLGVSGAITRAEAYSDEGRLNVALRFKSQEGATVSGVSFELYQNQPNPFKTKTTIEFYLPAAAEATLSIVDESGRVVYRQKGWFAAGANQVLLDASLLQQGAGVLFYTLETEHNSATRKMVKVNE